MTASDFARRVPGLAQLSHSEKIKLFAWFLHEEAKLDAFATADIRTCYADAHQHPPANLSSSIEALVSKRPPEILKQQGRFRLHGSIRAEYEKRFRLPESTVVVEQALSSLPARISDAGERAFLEETLICYRHHAFRAAIVMAWNLAYSHLVCWILADPARLNAFNLGIAKRNSKKAGVTITKRDDFEELKEDETVDIVGNIPGITSGMKRLLKEKLGRRNSYAHPSTIAVSKPQVDDMITDLVQNVILRLP
jgi:hypothetical protein